MHSKLTFGSLFSGCGGMDHGLHQAGLVPLWQCEVNPRRLDVLAAHYHNTIRYGDIRTLQTASIPAVDVVAFGSPCQGLSIAGKRAGLSDKRSALFHEAIRVIRELRQRTGSPTIIVWENVYGALTSNGGRDFAVVLDTLADIGALDICWRVLDAQYFGVAQRRRRVFLVADFDPTLRRAYKILFEPTGSTRHTKTSAREEHRIASTVTTRSNTALNEQGHYVAHTITSIGSDASEDGTGRGIPIVTAQTNDTVRKLTPIEIERLFGLPDNWTAPARSDAARYQMLGDAVAAPVAKFIGRRTLYALDEQ